MQPSAMIFIFVSIIVPIVIYIGLPPVLDAVMKPRKTSLWPLLVAGMLFFVSWYLPSPLIEGNNTQFTTHFLGGGVFCGFIWLWLWQRLGRVPGIMLGAGSLYTLVCVLGVSNELFELVITKYGLTTLSLKDTSWDLFANTLGALIFYVAYLACRALGAVKSKVFRN